MLFGLHRVGPKLHFFATCMVALGTELSASWILSANSWMQTPDGITIQNGRVVVTNWLKVVVNPSWLYRLPHMLMAALHHRLVFCRWRGCLVSAARQT